MTRVEDPQPWREPLPPATPPDGMALYQLPTGTYETRAMLAVRGGSFRDKRHFAANALLVCHPKGDLLIDAGFGENVAEHVKLLPVLVRPPYTRTATVKRQLVDAGYDFSRLRGVVVTHSHWDHTSGLDSLDVPIWISRGEREYAARDGDGKVFRAVAAGHEIHEYAFDGPAYLGFSSSFDVHDDGSVVIALAGGHTTGSVVVFVALPTGKRYAFIGDLTWQYDGIEKQLERPWLLRMLADSDARQVRRGIGLAAALTEVMQVVPSHDVGAYDGIPRLPEVMS